MKIGVKKMMNWLKANIGNVFFYSMMVLSGLSLAMVLSAPIPDNREFGDIVKQCREMGYIQDKVTRITCSIEK